MTVFALLKEIEQKTGIKFGFLTINGRIEVQKTVFLLKFFKIQGAMKYNFDIYLHGPYSSGLTNEYLNKGGMKLRFAESEDRIPDKTLEMIREITLQYKGKQEYIQFLEGLTTLISLRDNFDTPKEALNRARRLKPYMEESVWKEVIDFIEGKNLWECGNI